MPLRAALGLSNTIGSYESGSNTARQVVDQPGMGESALGILFVSSRHSFSQVLTGAATILGDIPVIGCSVAASIFDDGIQDHGVQLALLSGEGITAMVNWQPEFDEDSAAASTKLLAGLGFDHAGALFICADGFGGGAEKLVETLPKGAYQLAGVLAARDPRSTRTYQVAGQASGFGGIAGAALKGNVVMGAGQAHGWLPSGAYFVLSTVSGPFIVELDGQTPPEALASLFGFDADKWTSPPLDEFVRMYPLGIERGGGLSVQVRSPLRMELNGLLRMHAEVPQGDVAHVLVGSIGACARAVEQATEQALEQLNGAVPELGLVLVDVAWRQMLQSRAGMEIDIVRQALESAGYNGKELPLMGAYVYGHYGFGESGRPELFNQHVQVVLFGSKD